ncbi:MAG: peptidase domain-containing ABC transporter [Betaproteobacteria bacterium]|nr:peptidase domain-containing ABC transporter [Betaproteobacteria bacterium]
MAFEGLNLGFRKKLPVILQTEAAECGLASLAMVACYHGYVTDLGTLRSRHSISLKGTTLTELIKIATALNFQTRPLRLELDELRELKTPCLLHWDLSHFVVLANATANGIEIHDPAQGKRTLKYAEASKHFTGVALELTPDIQFEKKEEKQQLKLRTLFGKVTGLKTSLLQVFLLAGALEVFGIVAPFFSQWIIDDALVSGDQDLLTMLAIGVLFVALIRMAVGLIRSWVVMHLSTTLSLEWFANVFAHLLKLPVPWFEKRHLGDVVSRFGSLGSIQQAMTGGLIGAVLDGIMAVITLAMMFVYSPTLSAIAIAAVVLYAAVRIARYGALRDASAEQLVRQAKQQSHFMESIRGIQALKLFNREEDRRQRYLKLAVDTTNNGLSIQKQNMAFGAVNSFLVALENAAILYLGAKLVMSNQFSVGMLVAFISYKDQFITRISALIDTAISFRMLGIQAERLADIVLTLPEEAARDGYLSQDAIEASIEVRNVSFRYSPGEPWVLRDVNMTIEAGESVAIAGPSGCGKTTLLKIMLGQLQPEEGEVLVGGLPLKQLGLKYYRDQIGVVMQDDQLFAGSLAENIAFFDPQTSQERVEAAAKLAAIHEAIVKMPMGYNTLSGDMGTGLSGGQRQRVILARALYKRPRILFLDEATSNLDTNTELTVNQAIKRLSMTRITVAHRQSTLEMADRLIILPLSATRLTLRTNQTNI